MEEASKERNNEFLKEWRRQREAVRACLTECMTCALVVYMNDTWMRLKTNWQCQSRIRHINDQFDSVNPPDGHPHTRQFLRCAPQGEPEDAMMLQAFSDRKDAKNFARDVLQVSTMDTVTACDADVFQPNNPVPLMQKDCTHQRTWFDTCDQCLGSFRYISVHLIVWVSHGCLCLHRSGSAKFIQTNGNGNSCGDGEAEGCELPDYTDKNCWNINEALCIDGGSLEKQYTVKFENVMGSGSPTIGTSESISPPTNYPHICITGWCTKSGTNRLCTVIDNPVKGGAVTIVSGGGGGGGLADISDYKIQYACGTACDPSTDPPNGGGDGDPHIHTMKGDSYTLIKQGNFLAFSFKGKEALVAPPGHSGDGASVPVDFELFAHYSNGRKSFTRGLLLLDHQNHQAMEMTSEDCRWRVRAGPVVTESSLVIFLFRETLRKRMGKSQVLPPFCYKIWIRLKLFPFLRRRVRLEDLDGVEEVRIEVRSLVRSPVPTWERSLCHGLEHLKGRDDFEHPKKGAQQVPHPSRDPGFWREDSQELCKSRNSDQHEHTNRPRWCGEIDWNAFQGTTWTTTWTCPMPRICHLWAVNWADHADQRRLRHSCRWARAWSRWDRTHVSSTTRLGKSLAAARLRLCISRTKTIRPKASICWLPHAPKLTSRRPQRFVAKRGWRMRLLSPSQSACLMCAELGEMRFPNSLSSPGVKTTKPCMVINYRYYSNFKVFSRLIQHDQLGMKPVTCSSWPVTGDRWGPRVKLDVAHDERKQVTLQARLMVHLNVFRLVKYLNDISQMIWWTTATAMPQLVQRASKQRKLNIQII